MASAEFVGPVLLAKSYWRKDGRPFIPSPEGWLASEKFDGYRAVWTGQKFVSRTGKEFVAPEWFKAVMPVGVPLDGEFWLGRGNFENCGMFRRKKPKNEDWVGVQYVVFDAPAHPASFAKRLAFFTKQVSKSMNADPVNIAVHKCPEMEEHLPENWTPVVAVSHAAVESAEHLDQLLQASLDAGGEGLMIRDPESMYDKKRSKTLLKLKPSHDAEAVIIGYKAGEGKYKNMLGAFVCRPVEDAYGDQLASCKKLHKAEAETNSTEEAMDFCLSGMVDDVRKHYKTTHPVGTVITFTYTELTERGKPRHPRYMRIHHAHE